MVTWCGRRLRAGLLSFAIMGALELGAQGTEPVDLDAVQRIKGEAFERSQVMDTLSWLTDVHGPLHTGSPNMRAGVAWMVERLRHWGIPVVRVEPYEFGRGWSNERLVVHVLEPQPYPVIAQVKPWTRGTGGPVTGRAVHAVLRSEADLDAWRGRLAGTFVFGQDPCEPGLAEQPLSTRYTEERLRQLDRDPRPRPPSPRVAPGTPPSAARPPFWQRRLEFLEAEGVLALVEGGCMGIGGGTVFVGGGGSWKADAAKPLPQIVLAAEHYNRIVRTIAKGIEVRLEVDVRNTFHEEDLTAMNVIAELPGSDRADEIVMFGAHFDSVHPGTGATDNAIGAAVTMEAMRILAQTGLPRRRTVRLALWSGEEQVYLGSEAWVRRHVGDPATGTTGPEHGRISVYFNHDNGAGAIRGVYLQQNEAVRPIFEAWMGPLRSLGMTTLAIRPTGGTDHGSFDALGIPAFQFIQDPLEYETRTHHSNMDVYDRVPAADAMTNAAIVAAFVHHAANRPAMLPRKPRRVAAP